MDSRVVLLAVTALGAAPWPAPACADDGDQSWALDRADFWLGNYRSDLKLSARVNGEVGGTGTELDGTDIDFRRAFAFGGSHNLLFAGAAWRPFQRHQFSLDYHQDTRDESRSLSRELQFNGEIFPLQARVAARFEYRLIDAKYSYWPYLTQRDAFGLSLGVATYHVRVTLSGRASIDGGDTSASASTSADSDVPAPLIGLGYRHAFSERVRFFADASAFKASINAIDGTVGSVNAGFEYYPLEHVGLALLYTGTELDGEVSKHGFDGHLKLRSSGYQVQLRLRH